MSKVIETTVYTFDELSDEAKEKAREWHRGTYDYYEWWEGVCEDAEEVGLKIEHFDLGRGREIGLTFVECHEEVCRRVLKEHGDACDTYKAAVEYLAAVVGSRMVRTEAQGDVTVDMLAEFRAALENSYLKALDAEWEYQNSDEYVDESIRCNGFTFTVDGKRFG